MWLKEMQTDEIREFVGSQLAQYDKDPKARAKRDEKHTNRAGYEKWLNAEVQKKLDALAPAAAPEPEFDLEAQRAAARKNAAEFAANLTPEEAAIYGAKIQVAASGVRPDSDEEDDGGV